MSASRLFIYDLQTKRAVCIAKGYSTGWSSRGDNEHINRFFDDAPEFVYNIETSRYQLLMEHEIPHMTMIYWSDKTEIFLRRRQ